MSTASSRVTTASTAGEGNVAGGLSSSGISTSVVSSVSSVSVNPTIPTIGMFSGGAPTIGMFSGGAPISSGFPFYSGLNFGRTDSALGVLGSMYPNIPPLTSLGSMGATSAPNLPFTNNLTQVCNVKLDRNNYLLWKSTVLPIIRGHRLEGHVLGDESTHRSPSPYVGVSGSPFQRPQTQEEWNITDQLLMGWLMGSMTESALMEIVGCSSAREIWLTLEALFNSQSESRMLEYKSALTRAVKGSKSMHDYLAQMKSYADNLAAAGYPISKSELILATLGGLEREYEAVIVNLTTRVGSLTWQEVQSQLVTHERLLSRFNLGSAGGMTSGSSANVAVNFGLRPRSPGQGPNSRPQNASQNTGSRGRGGRNRGGGRGGRQSNSANRPVCQLCGKSGHTVVACWHRFEQDFVPPNSGDSRQNTALMATSC